MTKVEEVSVRLGQEAKVLTAGLQRAWASPDGRRKLIKFGIAGAALLSFGMLSLLAAMPSSSGRSNRPPAGFTPPPSAIAPVQQQGLPQTAAPGAPAVGAPIQAAPQPGAPAVGAPIQSGAFAPKADTRTVKVGTSEAIPSYGNGGPAPAMIGASGASNLGGPTIQPSIDLDSLVKREQQ